MGHNNGDDSVAAAPLGMRKRTAVTLTFREGEDHEARNPSAAIRNRYDHLMLIVRRRDVRHAVLG